MDEELFGVFFEQGKRKREGDTSVVCVKEEQDDLSTAHTIDDFCESTTKEKELTEVSSEEIPAKKLKAKSVLDISPNECISRIQIHTVDSAEVCLHEVAVPPDAEYIPLRNNSGTPAREYPFVLDPFQKEAIACLENNQSVLVSAHTSAGKTVVAEYAISLSLRSNQRVIYTTPIKALSNQKYREFFEEFQDVGLMTGDVTINPSAGCLIMTTEILRSMLYKGSEVMREVGWVVFDEIHYMRDKERGVVWEETIILLPDTVHYVFLSATIPNARQFAEWICHLHKQPCHVVYSEFRPVPLQQYVYPAGGSGMHLVVDEFGVFREENFNTAMNVLQLNTSSKSDSNMRGRKGGFKEGSNCFLLVKMIMERNFAPVIVFSFSKKECEAYAMQMLKIDFNSDKEKELVEEIFRNAMSILSDEDKLLPQVVNILPMLKKGIGIHHSGLLPILKETIEILFSEGLLKALFATETFAMGLNMPARTVLFTNARKFDGRDFRWITSGEYIQMSGRAGRRGIDERGIVILMVDEKISPSVGKEILKGLPDPINSAFHLTYNMILNLLRIEEINPEYMLERSFYQFQNNSEIPMLYDKLKKLCSESNEIEIQDEDEVASYFRIKNVLSVFEDKAHSFVAQPEHSLKFLHPGRLVRVVDGDDDFGWGVALDCHRKTEQCEDSYSKSITVHIVDVLLHVSKGSAQENVTSKKMPPMKPPPPGGKGTMEVVPIKLGLIRQFGSLRVFYPSDLKSHDNRMSVLDTLKKVKERFPSGIPILDPLTDMQIKDERFRGIMKKIKTLKFRLESHPLHNHAQKSHLLNLYKKKSKIGDEITAIRASMRKAKSLLQMDELRSRKSVLRRMGFCTAADVIEIKGRVACEISSADELILTEMIFNGLFNNLNVHQITALLSCFVFQEKSNEMPKLAEELSGPLAVMQDTARRIATITKQARLEIDADAYVELFKPHLMDVVHSWSKGVSFSHLCKMTDVFEGSIIRCMRRLEELLRQMYQAAKILGNLEMEYKFSEGIRLIKRDIVFAASLYL